MPATTTIANLDTLYTLLREAPADEDAQSDYAAANGLPLAHGVIDWTNLPTFGGAEPQDTVEIWSWDATRLLVGYCAADLAIVDRAEHEAR